MNTRFTEDEEERLIKVVEYLEPLMSRELLCKFPDNTAFDFDYSQSTIWSPLLPRRYNSMDFDFVTPIKLSSESGEMIQNNSLKKVTSTIKKSFRFSSLKSSSKMRRKKMNKTVVSDFSPKPVNKIKGWSKLLKAATKHFKKKKKKDQTSQKKLYF